VAGHISNGDLERYAIGRVKAEGELASLERHLLVCGWCIDRAERTDGYVEATRAALRRLQAKRKKKAGK
jgi:hypothetical protein